MNRLFRVMCCKKTDHQFDGDARLTPFKKSGKKGRGSVGISSSTNNSSNSSPQVSDIETPPKEVKEKGKWDYDEESKGLSVVIEDPEFDYISQATSQIRNFDHG